MDDSMYHCRHHRELEDARRERDLFRAAGEAAELRIVELRAERDAAEERLVERQYAAQELQLKNDDLIEQVRLMNVDNERLHALVSDQAATLRGFRDSIHRAEALVVRWNEASFVVHPNECADDLDAALRGEP